LGSIGGLMRLPSTRALSVGEAGSPDSELVRRRGETPETGIPAAVGDRGCGHLRRRIHESNRRLRKTGAARVLHDSLNIAGELRVAYRAGKDEEGQGKEAKIGGHGATPTN